MQNKKGRTITFRVDDEVVKLLPNCYKRLKISLALDGVFAPRFAFMGRQAWLRKPLRSPWKSLKSRNRHVIGADNGCWASIFGVIRLGVGVVCQMF